MWGDELSQLERKYIHQFDSVHNGYNIRGGSLVHHKPTDNEARVSWNGKTFHHSDISKLIYPAIKNYQANYHRKQEIIRLHGSIEQYERHKEHNRQRKEQEEQEKKRRREQEKRQRDASYTQNGSWETYQEHQANRTGCWTVFIILSLLTIIGLVSGC